MVFPVSGERGAEERVEAVVGKVAVEVAPGVAASIEDKCLFIAADTAEEDGALREELEAEERELEVVETSCDDRDVVLLTFVWGQGVAERLVDLPLRLEVLCVRNSRAVSRKWNGCWKS